MPFYLPEFPLIVNIWRGDDIQPAPPDVVCMGNLAGPRRAILYATPDLVMTLLVPKLTDIRPGWDTAIPDYVECPAGSGRFYLVMFVDDYGKGFANEHRFAVLAQNRNIVDGSPWPRPLP